MSLSVFQYPCFLADVNFILKPQNVNPSINNCKMNKIKNNTLHSQSWKALDFRSLAAEHIEQFLSASNTNGKAVFRLSIFKYGSINAYEKTVTHLMLQVLSVPKLYNPAPSLF